MRKHIYLRSLGKKKITFFSFLACYKINKICIYYLRKKIGYKRKVDASGY
jgi:hypothetical protein